MGSYKLKRLELLKNVIEVLEKQNVHTCKDALSFTVVELQFLLGISFNEAVKIQGAISRKCVSEPKTVYEIHENNSRCNKHNFFPSSLYDLDMLLQGGLLLGHVTEIAGPPGVGKTQFALMLSLLATLPISMGGLNSQVMYIDTESTFSACRLKEMAISKFPKLFHLESEIQQLLQRIFVHKVSSVRALKEIVSNMEQNIIKKKVKLVVIDSVASLFRKEYESSTLLSIIERNNILLEQASILKNIAQTYCIVVFLTNQITSNAVECHPMLSEYPSTEGDGEYGYETKSDFSSLLPPRKKAKIQRGMNLDHISPALGTAWSHCVNTRLTCQFLDSEMRQLIIAKSPIAPNAAVRYFLNESGVVLAGNDIEFFSAFNTECQNILTKYNFLTDEVAEKGTVFSMNSQRKKCNKHQ